MIISYCATCARQVKHARCPSSFGECEACSSARRRSRVDNRAVGNMDRPDNYKVRMARK